MYSSNIHIGAGLLQTDLINSLCHHPVLIADRALQSVGEKLAKKIGALLLTVPGGEASKTRDMKEMLEDNLLNKQFGKDTTIIALGGGVVTDLVGFLASTYMRGVPLILIPTTLLAMVDGAIGGKTAVNTPLGKNLIGTFYPPKAILIDLDLLQTLPQKEWTHGIAEILKYGFIADPTLLQLDNWEPAIRTSIQIKLGIVEKDPFEQGLRRILNFGHTIGHGIEQVSDYTIPHGEAVAFGCLVEAHLSQRLGYLPPLDFCKIERTIRRFPFSLRLPSTYTRAAFLNALRLDKKSPFRFVLLDRIGHPLPFDGAYVRPVSLEELEPTLDWMEHD